MLFEISEIMKDERNKKRRILWIRSSGKWAEIWFDDGNRDPDQYDASCKWYMLTDLIETSGLDEDVMQRGHVGLWLTWEGDRPVAVSRAFLHNNQLYQPESGDNP